MTAVATPTPVFVRISEAKRYFGVHPNTMYRWAAAGNFKIHKRGQVSLVEVAEVHRFITGEGEREAA